MVTGGGTLTPEEQHKAIDRAQALMDINRWGDAIETLLPAMAADPTSLQILGNLTLCYYHLGDGRAALHHADLAIKASPQNEWGHRLRSSILMALGEKGLAMESAREAVRLDPDCPPALYALCHAESACKRHKQAQKTLDKLREIAPDWSGTFEMSAIVAMERNRWGEAEEYLHDALSLDPDSYWAHNYMGTALRQQGRKREAIDYFLQAATINPGATTARANLKEAVKEYIGVPGIVFFLWIPILAMSPVLGLLVMVGTPFLAWVYRRDRIRQLPDTARLFAGLGDVVESQPTDNAPTVIQ
jgi:tetratricopeptide (TPR) repeat protein